MKDSTWSEHCVSYPDNATIVTPNIVTVFTVYDIINKQQPWIGSRYNNISALYNHQNCKKKPKYSLVPRPIPSFPMLYAKKWEREDGWREVRGLEYLAGQRSSDLQVANNDDTDISLSYCQDSERMFSVDRRYR